MILKKLAVKSFRNFEDAAFYFNPFLSIIVGKNSVGKTNLLESIYFITTGSGFRESRQDELVMSGKNKCEVEAEFGFDEEKLQFRIIIDTTRPHPKIYQVNKVKKRQFDYLAATAKVSIFSPSFLYVIDGTPSERRDFFDRTLGSLDLEYKKRLTNYESGLRRRNKILEGAEDKDLLSKELDFWDDYLIKQGHYLVSKRHEFANYLNHNKHLDSKSFQLHYIPNELSKERFGESFEKQWFVRKTLIGPHRDEYEIFIEYDTKEVQNIHKFGSRSEQRLALLWLLLNEIKLLQETYKQRPLLLLDDIFSELDVTNKSLVLNLIKEYQTVITTTDPFIEELIHMPHSIITLQ